MHLNKEEEKILNGEKGEGPAKAMELLVAIGKIYDADRLIPIESAQIAGVSYKTMGDAGLQFIQDFADLAKVKVEAMLNPAGMDLEEKNYESDDFRRKQAQLINAYRKLGIEMTCTCTPYLIGKRPEVGDHLAWSESSAVSFANSVLGARTNREGGPSALMAAIIGKTPNYGLHLKENRKPDIVYEVNAEVPYSLLGYLVGREIGEKIPYFKGLKPSEDDLKTLGAAMAATGSVAMYHAEGKTPEAGDFSTDELEKIKIESEDIEKIRDELRTNFEPDVIVIGCPHLSKNEMEDIGQRLKEKEKKNGPDLFVYTSRRVKEESNEAVAEIERFGKVISDTCMVVSPLEDNYNVAATNSGKAAAYLPRLANQEVIYADLKTLMEMIS
ncbi:MAG: aconitase X catalytic domain-containing protein [Candidatus Thermoplasmatota archaeon]|nr:aconitase X catalytic domain-containing protein [Candidatus Thermoplasmatota archaeon]